MDSIQANSKTAAEAVEAANWFEISDPAQLPATPTVSVLMLAYNHQDYLAEAIQAVLEQEADFDFELIIGEDCSSDGTLAIARQYQNLNPGIIRIITANLNIGASKNLIRILQASRGKFVAICEGDDFWLSPHKLQLQVDALEKKDDINLCFHKSATYENCRLIDSAYYYESRVYKLEEQVLADFHFMQTNTLIFRKSIVDDVFINFMKRNGAVGDFFLRFYSGINGAICINEQMGCYRVLSSGSWSSQFSNPEKQRKFFTHYLCDLENFDKALSLKYTELLSKYQVKLLNAVASSNIKFFDKFKILLSKARILGLANLLKFMTMAVIANDHFRSLKCFVKENLPIRVLSLMQSLLERGRLSIGGGSYVHSTVHILGRENIQIGRNSCVSEGCWLNVNRRQKGNIAIEIGDNCFIGKQNFFTSGARISIGDYTLTTIGCKFIGSSHKISDPGVPYLLSGTTSDDRIHVGVNCFIGAGVTVLGNVSIGHGSVIGADALVIRDIPPFSIATGNPAQVFRRYSFKQKGWIAASDMSPEDEAAMPDEQSYVSQLKAGFPQVTMPWIAAGKNMGDL